MNPRDAGFALGATLLEGGGAAALAERAPRGAGAAVKALLDNAGPDELGRVVARLRGGGGGDAAFQGVHPSWIAARLLDAPQPLLDAVARTLPDDARTAIAPLLEQHGRALPPATAGGGAAAASAFDADLVERFRAEAFPGLGDPAADPVEPEARWVARAAEEELRRVARECGLRVVSRAFSRIEREDLARLCHGLPPRDSVRLVSMVVELNEALAPEELRKVQATYLRLLHTVGISPELFDDTGLAFVAAAAVAPLGEAGRMALAYRLPDELGARLLDLSAAGALPEESAVAEYRKDLRLWIHEWIEAEWLRPLD